jgi:Ca2+-transporting ATPase
MVVTTLDVAGQRVDLRQAREASDAGPSGDSRVTLLLAGGALCNDALLDDDTSHLDGVGSYRVVGDPTEAAIVEAALRAGMAKPALEVLYPRVAEAPFDSARKRMSTVHRLPASDGRHVPGAQPLTVAILDLLLAIGHAHPARTQICWSAT